MSQPSSNNSSLNDSANQKLSKKPISINNTNVTRLHGINTIEINAARQMHSRTISARIPTTTTTRPNNQTSPPTFQPPRSITTTTTTTTKTSIRSTHKCNNPNNPHCPNCESIIIPAPVARMPILDTPSITIHDTWRITSQKGTILNSQQIDDWVQNKLKFNTLPEMIFGENYVKLENLKNGWELQFNALDSLKGVALNDSGIRVAYSEKWKKSKRIDHQRDQVDQESKDFDWTYTTAYRLSLIHI